MEEARASILISGPTDQLAGAAGRSLGVDAAMHEVFLPFDGDAGSVSSVEASERTEGTAAFRASFRRAYLETVVCRRLILDEKNCLAIARAWGIDWG